MRRRKRARLQCKQGAGRGSAENPAVACCSRGDSSQAALTTQPVRPPRGPHEYQEHTRMKFSSIACSRWLIAGALLSGALHVPHAHALGLVLPTNNRVAIG